MTHGKLITLSISQVLEDHTYHMQHCEAVLLSAEPNKFQLRPCLYSQGGGGGAFPVPHDLPLGAFTTSDWPQHKFSLSYRI